MSQANLARLCGVTSAAIHNILTQSGRRKACTFAEKLADALGVEVGWLVYGAGSQECRPDALAPGPGAAGVVDLAGLSVIQAAAVATMVDLMRKGVITDGAALDLLQSHREHVK